MRDKSRFTNTQTFENFIFRVSHMQSLF